MQPVDLAKVEHADDVAVSERRRELGLSLELLHELFIFAERRKHSFEAHALLKASRPLAGCFEGFGHSADAQTPDDAKRAELPRHFCHLYGAILALV